MSKKKLMNRQERLNAELLAGIREAEALRRGRDRGQGRPPEEEDEGEERARGSRAAAGEDRP